MPGHLLNVQLAERRLDVDKVFGKALTAGGGVGQPCMYFRDRGATLQRIAGGICLNAPTWFE